MERGVQAIVAGGLAMVAGLWLAAAVRTETGIRIAAWLAAIGGGVVVLAGLRRMLAS